MCTLPFSIIYTGFIYCTWGMHRQIEVWLLASLLTFKLITLGNSCWKTPVSWSPCLPPAGSLIWVFPLYDSSCFFVTLTRSQEWNLEMLQSHLLYDFSLRVVLDSCKYHKYKLGVFHRRLKTLFINGGHIYNSFVHLQISLPSLILEQEFFLIHCWVSRFGRLICTSTKEL